jgi:hypothetical protein
VRTETAYNIVIDSSGVTTTELKKLPDPNPKSPTKMPTDNETTNTACNCPSTLPPNGNAGGDLSGAYPDPTVQKLNGKPLSNTAPKVGDTLRWNGTAWEPGAEMQTFFKKLDPKTNTAVELNGITYWLHKITGLTHTIVLNKKSRLIINAVIGVRGPGNFVTGITSSQGNLHFRINNEFKPEKDGYTAFSVEQVRNINVNLSNYMVDLEPGTYLIEFFVQHELSTSNFSAYGQYSSIMVLPL